MSEQEKINLYSHLRDAMKRSTKTMLERKAKLGETVIIADAEGNPIELSADEALRIYNTSVINPNR